MFLRQFEIFKKIFKTFLHPIGFLLLLANGICIAEKLLTQEDFNHVLNLPSGLEIKWKSGNPEWITFELRAPTNGYIGIGFSRDGRMSHSDIHIGWVDSSGQGHIKDLYSGSTSRDLFVDSSQDVELIKAHEMNNWTSITFRRRWDTCDNMDFPITEDTMRLIWAWSEEDPVEYLDGTMKLLPYHQKDETKRGGRSVFMKTRNSPGLKLFPDEEPMYPEDVKHFDFSVSNIRIPKADSYHHCRILKFPTLSRKHHVIAYRPLRESHSRYLYQMNLFRCDSVGSTVFEKYVDYPGQDCYEDESSIEWYTHCTELRTSLSFGAEGDIFPEHFGQSISSKDTFYLLEMHYENPMGDYVLDNSGLRVFFSSKLRKFDLGLMVVGHRLSPFLSVPPRQKDFTVSSLCSEECTSNGLRPEGVKIVSVLLRTHSTGKAMSLRHIRKGKELSVISYDKNIDYKYQSYRRLLKEVPFLPGDQLIIECTYDTSTNTSFIYGGMSPRSETCEAVLVYYPKSALMDCRSEPELFSYLEPLGVRNVANNSASSENDLTLNSIIEERMRNEMSRETSGSMFTQILVRSSRGIRSVFLSDFLGSLDWSSDYFTKLTEQKWRYGMQSVYCYGLHGQRINTSKVVEFPSFIERIPMSPPETSCFAKLAAVSSADSLMHSFLSRIHYIYMFIFVVLLF